jgi:hypothetical protein
MNHVRQATVNVIVTDTQLVELAQCSRRMADYADVDGSLLIAIVESQDGMPVRLVLDRSCIHTRESKSASFDSS